GSLLNAALKTGCRASSLLSPLPAEEALNLVMWAVYGDDDSRREKLVGSRESLYPFEILPQGDPFFDGWEAIIIEERNAERFIFRKRGQPACEITWEPGTFKDTVLKAQAAFRNISMLGSK